MPWRIRTYKLKRNKQLLSIVIIILSTLILSCRGIIWDMNESQKEYSAALHFLESNDNFEELWTMSDLSLSGGDQRSTVVGGSGMVILEGLKKGSYLNLNSTLVGLNSVTGNIIWQSLATGSGSGEKIVSNNILYRGTSGTATIQAYNIEDGGLMWQTRLLGGHSVVDIYFAENRLFAYTSDSEFFILNEGGRILDNFSDGLRVFLEMNGILYKEGDFAITAIDSSTKKELWRSEIEDYYTHSPIFDNGTIILRTRTLPAYIYSIDQYTGKVNWKISEDVLSNLYVSNGEIYFLSSDGCLVALDKTSGSEILRLRFSPAFDLQEEYGGYFVSGDSDNDVLVVAFGDNTQILGLRIKN